MAHSRLLPASGAVPRPGEDITGTQWQQYMDRRETALFCLSPEGNLLKLNGQTPESPISEYCTAYRSRFRARLVAKGTVTLHPQVTCALYDKGGRWLETFSTEGVRVRNEGLRFAWLLLQAPITLFLGLALMAVAYLLISTYQPMAPITQYLVLSDAGALIIGGLLVGGIARGLVYLGRLLFHYLSARPALQPWGSPKREAFYKNLPRKNLLVPEDISLKPAEVRWPELNKHHEWTTVLRQQKFTLAGQYLIPEVAAEIEFWIHPERALTASIVSARQAGMWFAATSRYPDGSSFSVANKLPSGVDPYPQQRTLCIGPDKSAEEVLEQALSQRPPDNCVRPVMEQVAPDFIHQWKTHIQWRRERGITIEEFKRIDTRRLARRAIANAKNQ